MKPSKSASCLRCWAWIVSGLVWGIVVGLRYIQIPLPEGVSLTFLPALHAILNTLCAIFLIVAYVAIAKYRNKLVHKRFITTALICSLLFLLSYVTYHSTTPPIIYEGQGLSRTIYYSLLISHIISAGLSLPFILLTWVAGFTNDLTRHKNLAVWVFPVWLYVAVSGPICYLMLKPYY